jgi:hypothetical protein
MGELSSLLRDFGPLIGVVIFFIWRDWRREENLVERVRNLEEFNTEVLTSMVKEQAGIIATNTSVVQANTEQMRAFAELMTRFRLERDG